MEMQDKKIIGRLEYVSFPDFGIEHIEAKIDTGAYSGSIHVSSVEEIEHGGVGAIRFRLIDEDHPQYQSVDHVVTDFKKKTVKSSNGVVEDRYFIKIPFVLGGQTYIGIFSLSNRANMRYPILLGRKLLKKYFLVDPSQMYMLSSHNN